MQENLEKREQIKELLKQGCGYNQIVKELHTSKSVVSECNKELRMILEPKSVLWELGKDDIKKLDLVKNLTPKQIEEILYHNTIATKENIIKTIGEPWHLKFWLVSDTHFGNKQQAKDELGEFYDRAKDMGVECFMHAGDLVDGDWVYTGQVYELSKLGFDAQLDDVVNSYPDVWLDTYMIGGNHDESFLKKTGWDIMRAISVVRRDMINLGFYDARIKLNGVDINLHHWGWSMSYAKSYKIQKLLENINPKDQPNIFASGHRHTSLYVFYRKIHSFLPWAFLKENLLAKRFNLDNTIGGWVIEIDIDEKGWSHIKTEFLHIK